MTKQTILNRALIDGLCHVIGQGATNTTACRVIGISRTTLHNWLKRAEQDGDADTVYTELRTELDKARGFRELAWIEALIAKKEFPWLLSHHADTRADFGEAQTVKRETTVKVTKPDVDAYIAQIEWYRNHLKEKEAQKEG
ncbi:MAG: helix-turn-helix domain-containing protein [Halobacteriota archaeon]